MLAIITLFVCMTTITSCYKMEDDGSRGFMCNATIIGDTINGYYCYLDIGGVAISCDNNLAGATRGCFSIKYNEKDWTIGEDNQMLINNAHVFEWTKYNIIYPISKNEAEIKHLTHKDECEVPSLLTIGYGYRGYLNLNTGISVMNLENREEVPTEINLIYDPEEETKDTLHLQLCYAPHIPDNWSKVSFEYNTISCDISSLANLRQWSDSITIVVDARDNYKHSTKISKNDFFKPNIKVD